MLQNQPDLWYWDKRKKWHLVVHEKDHAGKTFRRPISTGCSKNQRQEAKVFLTKWLEKRAEGNSKISQPHTVANALNEAFNSKRENDNLRASSCREIERSIRFFVEFICEETGEEKYPVQLIDFELCDSFLRSIKSPHQRITHRANLHTLWNTLIDFRKKYGITENPFARTKKPRLPQTDPEQIVDKEFTEWYERAWTDTFLRQMCKLASAFSYYTGLREAEVCYIRTKHTTGENVQVRNYSDHTVKGNLKRDVPHTDKTEEIIQLVLRLKSQHRSVRVRESEYLFCTEQGSNVNKDTLSKYFTECRRESLPERTKVTFHALRRSFGQNLVNGGVSLEEVSKLLGHSSIAVTEKHYANTRNMTLSGVKEKMNAVHSKTPSLERPSALTPEAEHPELSEAMLNSLGVSTGAEE